MDKHRNRSKWVKKKTGWLIGDEWYLNKTIEFPILSMIRIN